MSLAQAAMVAAGASAGMAKLLEWFGLGWGVLTAVAIGFVALLAWRTHQRAVVVQSAVVRPAAPVLPPGDLRPAAFESRELGVDHEISTTLAEVQDMAHRHRVELQIAVQPHLAVWADPGVLRRMLAGMLTQAVERAEGGAVLLSASWHGGRVQMTVTDDRPAGDHAVLVGKLREVEQCAALQGGTLEIECWKLRGNRVVLRMPGKLMPDRPAADDDDISDAPVAGVSDARDTAWTGAAGAS
jgi:hypothetical protein